MHPVHPAVEARLRQEEAFDSERLTPTVAPGSSEEARALAKIDQAREEEREKLAETLARRRSRASTYWRRHARD